MKYPKFQITLILIMLSGVFFIVSAQMENYTFSLTQSTPQYTFWTTTPSIRVFKDSPVPKMTGSSINVFCAKNETEPFVVVVKPAQSGTVTISVGNFGSGIEAELNQVKYVPITTPSDNLGKTGFYPDPVMPIANNASVTVTANENTEYWVTLFVSSTAVAGDYTSSITLGGVTIPVKLHVFNFVMPSELHVESQMNLSYETILSKYGVTGTSTDYWNYVEKIKLFFIRRRLTPTNPTWPGGLTSSGGESFVNYDCNGTISDPYGIWGFEGPAEKYIKGTGFNSGTGFPSFQAISFRNNDASADQRPGTFCTNTLSQSDWYSGNNPQSAYNLKWFSYLKSLQDYLNGQSLLGKAYYYLANEPQDQAGYDAVAWYTQEIKKNAPLLKLMVSEEPRSEIYSHPTYRGAKVDIWLPVLQNYNPSISWEREKSNGEKTWIYFLHSTRPPYFNPVTVDHPGIESKLTGWFLWKYRIRGIAYYALNDWSQNPWTNPRANNHNGDLFMLYPPSESNTAIAFGATDHRLVSSQRLELMRDGLEDFEYLYLLNNGKLPEVLQENASDSQVNKIISGLTSYSRDDEFMYNIRRLMGLKLGGELLTIPNITPQGTHPRAAGAPGNYFINFQDPNGAPLVNPLVVDGNTYMKIGWNNYNDSLGHGWFGDMANVKYSYLSTGPNELQKSVIYDDWGRLKTFEFACPNGEYDVTISVGWAGKGYQHQKVAVEGVNFVNDEATTVAAPYLIRSKPVTISDQKLTMEMGIFDEYTMLNYMTIIARGTPVRHIQKTTYSKTVTVSSSHNGISLLCNNPEILSASIFNSTGKLLYNFPIKYKMGVIGRAQVQSGLYFVRVDNKYGTLHLEKVIVR